MNGMWSTVLYVPVPQERRTGMLKSETLKLEFETKMAANFT